MRLELLTPPTSTLNSIVREQREFYTESRAYVIEWHICMRQEVQEAIFHAGNTSPGPDKTPPFVIKTAWPVYMEQITLLFQLCLQERYHPLAFKNAILCVLPKPGKRPRHLLRSYRLIALLSCLRKVLERIVLEQTDLSKRFHEIPWVFMRFYAHAARRLQKILHVQSYRVIFQLFLEGSILLRCI